MVTDGKKSDALDSSSASLDNPALRNRVVVLNGFDNDEIVAIMRAVKGLCKPGVNGEAPKLSIESSELIFAKTTPSSLRSVLADLIVDMSGDHAYLKKNPPKI